MKNEVVIQSQAVSLRNLENHIRQLAIALKNKPQVVYLAIQRIQGEKEKNISRRLT